LTSLKIDLMTTDLLRRKTGRYLCGEAIPAEAKQIQNWLSVTADNKSGVSSEERAGIEGQIVTQVQAYVACTLFQPPKQDTWWRKITAFF
jgi:hypothetical protein